MSINDKTAAKLYRWALSEGVLFPPFLRLNSHSNFQEYVYFLKFREVQSIYRKLKVDPRVVYEALCSGAFDLMVMSSEKIDFSMENGFEYFILAGPRSDYIYNKVEKKSFGEYFNQLSDFLETENFIKSRITFPERGELIWDDLDLSFFRV